MSSLNMEAEKQWLIRLQDSICAALEQEEPEAKFLRESFAVDGGGESRPRVLEGGRTIERAAVNFTHTKGNSLPAAATARKPELVGKSYEAVSVSLIVHPRNPKAPTTHANFRCFMAGEDGEPGTWWFGGGFDLTPYYGFDEDCAHWHEVAEAACRPFGGEVYRETKLWCDRYFYLPHRNEPRGIGGVFFDDWDQGGFAQSQGFWRSVGEAFVPAYIPILNRRKDMPFSDEERAFQLYRRGRYVEFNLAYDRGTKYGLQSKKGRIESILASMPPVVHWRYDWSPESGTEEARLYEHFLVPRQWTVEGFPVDQASIDHTS